MLPCFLLLLNLVLRFPLSVAQPAVLAFAFFTLTKFIVFCPQSFVLTLCAVGGLAINRGASSQQGLGATTIYL